MKHFFIHKASGEKEKFSQTKLQQSLTRAGIAGAAAEDITRAVVGKIKPRASSEEIYQATVQAIHDRNPVQAMRYRLKRAIMELGPAGYQFERYVGSIFTHYGYQTEVDKIIQGHCVQHEVDVLAVKDERHMMIECKYHNRPGVKSDVQVALYVQARFIDIDTAWHENPRDSHKIHEVWLITNTKLTSDAVQYGRCQGMRLISWGYPSTENLQQIIENKGLYPLTILPYFSNQQKRAILQAGFVLAGDLLDKNRFLSIVKLARLNLNEKESDRIRKEVRALCGPRGNVL